MPLVSRTFIKAGMIFFGLALLTGLIIEAEIPSLPRLSPLFWHMLTVGWITQTIFGVSIWMFPGRTREEGFKPQKWGWITFIFINTGLSLRVIAEPLSIYQSSEVWNALLALSAMLQLLAGITYLIELWPRVLSKEQQRKRRKKKRKSGAS